MGLGTRLKAMDGRNLPKLVKVALRMKDKLPRALMSFSSGLRTSTQGFILSTGGYFTGNLSQKAKDLCSL
jgi:hypothetical protein